MPLNVVGIDRFTLGPLFLLVEDYCAPLMNDDLPADVTPNSPRQNHPFEIVAKADQVLHRAATPYQASSVMEKLEMSHFRRV